MTPDAALDRQLELYRKMTGQQRLKIAVDLHALSCDVAREGIRHQFPGADEGELERRLRQRIAMSNATAESENARCETICPRNS